MAILEIGNVDKRYGDLYSLRNINLTVESGEWIAIMGPSGSGKSTLIHLIGCLDKPTQGNIRINGSETSKLNKKQLTLLRRETIGLVFQQFHLIQHLTALENVMLAQYYHSMQDKDEAFAALQQVGLADRAHHFPAQLSGGEQQRVCIARALINYPALLLADEPTGNLDDANEKIIMELFQKLHKAGHTIVMVTHDDEVAEFAQRLVVLENGEISSITEKSSYLA